MVLLSNWEDQIIYDADPHSSSSYVAPEDALTTAVNTHLESGSWTQSIIWDNKTPFKDFTQIEFNEDEVQEERHIGITCNFESNFMH